MGIERQLQTAVVEANADILTHTEAIVHAIIGHAGVAAGLEEPFELRPAITEPALPVRRTEFIDGLGVGVMADAAVPVNRLDCSAAVDEGDGKE